MFCKKVIIWATLELDHPNIAFPVTDYSMDVIWKRSPLRERGSRSRHKIGESSFIEFNAQRLTMEIFRSWMRQPVPSSSIKIAWSTGILKEYENPSHSLCTR